MRHKTMGQYKKRSQMPFCKTKAFTNILDDFTKLSQVKTNQLTLALKIDSRALSSVEWTKNLHRENRGQSRA